jgi:hypothetical protein
MSTDPSPPQPLRRLKWLILGLTILLITLLESYHFISGNGVMGHVIAWLLGVIAVFLVSFRSKVGRLQHLDRQREVACSSSARPSWCSSASSSPHPDEERIANLVNELRHPWATLMSSAVAKKLKRRPAPAPFTTRPARNSPAGRRRGAREPGGPEGDLETSVAGSCYLSGASQAALAIVNSRLLEEQRKQRLNAELREAELRSQQRSLNLLNQITQAALRSPDLISMLQTLTQELADLFRADDALLVSWDSQREQPQLVAHCTAEPVPGRDPAIPSGDSGICGDCAEHGLPLVLPQVEKSALAAPTW